MKPSDCNCTPFAMPNGQIVATIDGETIVSARPMQPEAAPARVTFTFRFCQRPWKILRDANDRLYAEDNPLGPDYICDGIKQLQSLGRISKEEADEMIAFIRLQVSRIKRHFTVLYYAYYMSCQETLPRDGIKDPEWIEIRESIINRWIIQLRASEQT